MLWEYNKNFIGIVYDRAPNAKDWHSKNLFMQYPNNQYGDWIYQVRLDYYSNEDYIKKKIILLELERKTIVNTALPSIKQTYLKCLITNPYLNNRTSVDWVNIKWLIPAGTKTMQEIKIDLLKEMINENKLKKLTK